jgi:hypothetical protein
METNQITQSVGAPRPEKYRGWSRQVAASGLLGAIASLAGAMGLFQLGKLLTVPSSQLAQSDAGLLMLSVAAILALVITQLWFMVSLIGFGFRAIQAAVGRGYVSQQKPGFFIASWFIPVISIYLPATQLSALAGFTAGESVRKRKREVMTFWVIWLLIQFGFSSIASAPTDNLTDPQIISLLAAFGAISAFQAVPLMLGRRMVAEFTADLDGRS